MIQGSSPVDHHPCLSRLKTIGTNKKRKAAAKTPTPRVNETDYASQK
jgi:hypothetical protein